MDMNKENMIKSFVINKLGCNCPDEVFNIIKWQKDVQIDKNIILNYKINIGNRLLIYIIEIEDHNFINDNLVKIFMLGIGERNNNKFNRFRLAIISNNIAEIDSIAQNILNNLNIGDQKVHLHVIMKKDFIL
jgi:hypothetical protein